MLSDVTTLYSEAEREDGLRKLGMSTERRVDPQILVGLLVDQGGFPLELQEVAGNRGETLTLLPALDRFRERHSATDVVVVADAGMRAAANLNRLEDAGFRPAQYPAAGRFPGIRGSLQPLHATGMGSAMDDRAGAAELDRHLDGIGAIMVSHFAYEERRSGVR